MLKYPKLFGAAAATLALTALLAPIATATPKHTQTLRFYAVSASYKLYNAKGKPLTLPVPSAGDSVVVDGPDYVGSSTHHAGKSTGSDHLVCKLRNTKDGSCDFKITLGASRLRATGPFTLGASHGTWKVTSGSRKYKGAHGSVAFTGLPDGNTNLVIKVS